jgi:hypothetical protein
MTDAARPAKDYYFGTETVEDGQFPIGGRMQSLLWGVAALACPVGMGLMMWMMMRGHHDDAAGQTQSTQQVEQLRAEIEQFKAERGADRAAGGQ